VAYTFLVKVCVGNLWGTSCAHLSLTHHKRNFKDKFIFALVLELNNKQYD